MTTLAESFSFTQTSLRDYVECPRRFQLRYVLEQPWPAVASEPLLERERLAELGRRFHRMAQQHIIGLPTDQITASASQPDLMRWWWNLLNIPPRDLPSTLRRTEVLLTAPLGSYRLAAKYDLLALEPGRRAVIVDWKTERKRPTRAQLADRMQTRVYRYVLAEAGTALNGGQPITPEQITLIYWFAEYPAETEVLPYNSAQHAEDAGFLSKLVSEIVAYPETDWPKTDDHKRCDYCVYRSLCDRGSSAGTSDDSDIEDDLDVQLGEVEEIAY